MSEQDERISEVVARDRTKLRNFIQRRVADPFEAEDILQDVFYELVEAYRVMQPIEHVTAWLYRVARNRITDLFRRKRIEISRREAASADDDDDRRMLTDLLPSDDAGPEAAYARGVRLEELDAALEELPAYQRDVFVAHEIEGYSFREIAQRTGVGIKTLISRKHYAVVHLRLRLQAIYDEFAGRGI
jgi:RNA polymerase sigma factor (sigma-70 family)